MKNCCFAVFIFIVMFGFAYANTCDKQKELGRNWAELNFIVGMMDSSFFNGGWTLSNYEPYSSMTYDEQAFLSKAKTRQKAIFAKQGLQWNETNIRTQAEKARLNLLQANKDCEAKQKKSVLD